MAQAFRCVARMKNTPNAVGKRLVSVEVLNKQTQQWERPIDDNKRYLVGTNAYVAGGKDGYKTFG